MKKWNLLYVDDEQSNLRIFKDTFRRKFNIFLASSAKEGMEIMEKHNIDLILSDQRMPEMTGVELLKHSFLKFPKINRILITGYSDFEAIEDAINKAKIFQYVQKPWDEGALLDIISDALRVYELEEENEKQKEELKIAKLKAEQSDRLKTEFIYNLTHEIRTPMNGIIGFSSLLDSPELSDSEKKHFIKIIQNSSNQLLQIIDNILEISQLVTKQVSSQENEVNLNELFSELHSVFNLQAKERQITFICNPGLTNAESIIISDRSKLYTILSNLIENALKFTEKGTIEFGYTLNENLIKAFVKDTGVGINSENKEIIFQRFSQEDKEISNKVGGLGLGLSIAYENAKLIDVEISLESTKGIGSTFYIAIPYISPTNNSQSKSSVEQNNEIKENKPIKVLITEDEEVNLMYLDTIIKKYINSEIEIFHARNGVEAINICFENPDIDLVLMDIKMPIMDGYEASREIKKTRPDIPIVAQTAYSTTEDKQRALDSGCIDFISKPIKPKLLKSVFEKFTTVHLQINLDAN